MRAHPTDLDDENRFGTTFTKAATAVPRAPLAPETPPGWAHKPLDDPPNNATFQGRAALWLQPATVRVRAGPQTFHGAKTVDTRRSCLVLITGGFRNGHNGNESQFAATTIQYIRNMTTSSPAEVRTHATDRSWLDHEVY